MQFFNRYARVEIVDSNSIILYKFENSNGLGFRISFEVENIAPVNISSNSVNSSSVMIYNITEETVVKIRNGLHSIRLYAGYESQYGLVLDNVISNTYFFRTKTETVLQIFTMSTFTTNLLGQYYDTGTPLSEVLTEIAPKTDDNGNAITTKIDSSINEELKSPLVVAGSWDSVSSIVSKRFNIRISRNQKEIIFYKGDRIPKDLQKNTLTLSEKNGIIGIPKIGAMGNQLEVVVNNLLRTDIVQFSLVNIVLEKPVFANIQGFLSSQTEFGKAYTTAYIGSQLQGLSVQAIKYTGDTHAQEWYTNYTLIGVNIFI